MTATVEKVNGHAVAAEPRFDPVALAEAAAIRARSEAEAEAIRIKAQGEADAARALGVEEAEKLRITNERAAMRVEKERADHKAHLAKKAAEAAKSRADEEKDNKAAAEREAAEAKRDAEQQRSELWWKWGARGIYAIGLIIAAPVQFMHFWDPKRPFLVAAPGLLEGLALVLAFGAAWAVAHRRDVAPYRIGIMLGALIAAGINLHGGLSDLRIGFNAGLIGAIASLGGPIVLMAYEHGIAQKADGIPSWRERRAAQKAETEAEAAKAKAKAERQAAETKAAAEKAAAQKAAEVEQKRRDDDRRAAHEKVWNTADAMRSARGSQYVTEQIWAEAWYRETGSKLVGITPEIEARSKAAQARMKAAAECPLDDAMSQVESQMPTRTKREPGDVDRRRFNGGIPPLRTAGDTEPYSDAARKAAALTATQNATPEEQS